MHYIQGGFGEIRELPRCEVGPEAFDAMFGVTSVFAHGLHKFILGPLDISRDRCWITDLVKVFLFKPDHIRNYSREGQSPEFKSIRAEFNRYAKRSLGFLEQEIEIAQPVLVLTLGEEVARVVSDDYETPTRILLVGAPHENTVGRTRCTVAHVAYPDACRRSVVWRSRTSGQMRLLRTYLSKHEIALDSRDGT